MVFSLLKEFDRILELAIEVAILLEYVPVFILLAGLALQNHRVNEKRRLNWHRFSPNLFKPFSRRTYRQIPPSDAIKIIRRIATTSDIIISEKKAYQISWKGLVDNIDESKVEATIFISKIGLESGYNLPNQKTWVRWHILFSETDPTEIEIRTELVAPEMQEPDLRLILKELTQRLDEQIRAYIQSIRYFGRTAEITSSLIDRTGVSKSLDFKSIQLRHEGSVTLPIREYAGVNEEEAIKCIKMVCANSSILSDAISGRQHLRWTGQVQESLSRKNELNVKIKFTDYGQASNDLTEELNMDWVISKNTNSTCLECSWHGAFQQSTGDMVRFLSEQVDNELQDIEIKKTGVHNPAQKRARAGKHPEKTVKQFWPSMQDYNEAVQNPISCFSDEILKSSTVDLNQLGLPRVMSGAFANVYKFSNGRESYAVRCFINELKDEDVRYEKTSRFICADDLIYTVDLSYLKEGVFVKGAWFPIIKMEWIEGSTVNDYVEEHLRKPEKIRSLRTRFQIMMNALRDAGIAHADLQHGNMIIRNEDFILVDYDAMFVPELSGFHSNEKGHPNYQHPLREGRHFGPFVDNFSAWIIDTALLCAERDPSVWTSHADCEAMIFRKKDFDLPGKSQLFSSLLSHSDNEIRERAERIVHYLGLNVEQIPYLEY